MPSGFANEEYTIGTQSAALSLSGCTPDQNVVADTNGWFLHYPEEVVNSQQGCRHVRYGGVVDTRERVLHSDPAWRAARKAAEDRRLVRIRPAV